MCRKIFYCIVSLTLQETISYYDWGGHLVSFLINFAPKWSILNYFAESVIQKLRIFDVDSMLAFIFMKLFFIQFVL